ncbi:MAG: sensor histidine kinase [Planctomycetota bacterium]
MLVVLSLLRAGEQARAQRAFDASRNARIMADTLRATLRDPAVLDVCPEGTRFVRTAQGGFEVPADVGWLEPLAAMPADPVVDARLLRAQQDEFARGDQTAAAAAFDELLGERGPQGRARLPVLAAAAWQAQRADDAARRQRLGDALASALQGRPRADLALPEVADAVAALALLDATSGALRNWLADLLPGLPEEQAAALARRLSERGVDTAAFDGARREVAARRALLREVGAELARSPAAPRQSGGAVLLWFPSADDAGVAGQGALCPPAILGERLVAVARRGLPPVPDLGDQRFAPGPRAAAPVLAEAVVPGLWWVVPRVSTAPVPWTARPEAALAAAAALLAVLLACGWLAGRAVRQEARAVAERVQFVTVVTHELKTPLAAIRLLAEMLVEGRAPAGKVPDYYRLLAGEAARLSMLIENVLDLGRMARGERAYDLRPGDLGDVADEAAALFAPIAERDGLRFLLHAADRAAPARFDRGALLQALLNVLDNARKYGAAGGAIALRVAVREGRCEVVVRDRGPGVPEAEREAVFAQFARGRAHRSGAIPGVGLGLHLAREIARQHGGALRCRAPQDGGPGVEFAFELPLADSSDPSDAGRGAPARPATEVSP